jgi:diguanylate cyclase (GGDEF)-like protein
LLVVPVLARGTAQAMLVLENGLSRSAFTAQRLDAVQLVAGQLAVSIDNALVYASLERKVAERTEALVAANERLEALSTTDPLTGLANRRRLADVLDAEWQRALRPAAPVAVAMIDIAHFTRFNDLYGHVAGDACLRDVAAVLSQHVRPGTDLVARYGGEEFAVVLPGASLAVAAAIADRVRAAVVELARPHADSGDGVVTVSIGVAAAVATPHGDPRELIEAADVQLYAAKRAGRNRVVSIRTASPPASASC